MVLGRLKSFSFLRIIKKIFKKTVENVKSDTYKLFNTNDSVYLRVALHNSRVSNMVMPHFKMW